MLNLKGIWIPIEILIDKNLSDKEKIIYAIILFLSQENNYCYCTNTTLSEMFYISTTQVSKLINSLKSKRYIATEIIYKENSKQIEQRRLIPLQNNYDTYERKVKYTSTRKLQQPIQQKLKDNKYNNKINYKNNYYEGRDYSDIDLRYLYANADAFTDLEWMLIVKEMGIKCTIFNMKTYPIEFNFITKEKDKIIGKEMLEILDFWKKCCMEFKRYNTSKRSEREKKLYS